MSKSIRLSEKHGVNPTIPVCLFCGEDKNQIAFLGKLKGDVEAPRRMLMDYEPCDKCKENWEQGVTLIGVVQSPPQQGMPPIHDTGNVRLYPTGNAVTITNLEVAREFLNDPELVKGAKTLADEEILQKLISNAQGAE